MDKDDEFIDSLYDDADKQLNETYKKKKESRDELLKAIAMILLTYTIVDDVLSLSEKDYNKEYSLLGALIIKLTRGNIKQETSNTTSILRNTIKNTYKHYSYNHNLKDVEKIINDNFKGKHFSDRVWENEQEVAKKLTQQCQDFLRGKINVNQIQSEIKKTYNTSAYNAKRLAETEVSRCHNAAFDRFCKETGVKKVKYNARKCNTCTRCMDDDGKIFDFKNKPELPRHPMCKCYYDIVDDNKRVTTSNKSDIIKEIISDSIKYQVVREIVNSEEYKQKFNNIGSKKQNEVTCKETKRIVKRHDGTNTESYSIIDNKGNIIATQSSGAFGGVVDLTCLQDLPNNSVVLTHNHPLSTSFSDDDLALLMNNPQIKTIIAAGHDGTVYKLSIGKGIRTEMSKTTGRNSIMQEYKELMMNKISPNEIVEILSYKYNWKYEVI